MNFFSRAIPLVLTSLVGLLIVGAYFVPLGREWIEEAEVWFSILAAIAFVLGGANLFWHHLKKISDRQTGWGYSAVTLIAFTVTLVVGLLKVGVPPAELYPDYEWSGSYQAEGGVFWWIFEYAINPLTATMFSLLAFYVASAAFRALRAKNTEATLLLLTALIILLGRTYAGTWLTSGVPESWWGLTFPGLTVIIMAVFNTAGQRAIMLGIALGVVATSLKILLGMDRSWLGGEGE